MKTTASTRLWLKGSIVCTLGMLALGAGRAISVDASVTAIDILLEPDTTMLQHAAATNAQRMDQTFWQHCSSIRHAKGGRNRVAPAR